MRIIARALGVGILLAATLSFSTAAERWSWPLQFSPQSAKSLQTLHARLRQAACEASAAYHVENRTWNEVGFEAQLVSGTIFLCPAIDGEPVWAHFYGQARVTYRPPTKAGKVELRRWLDSDSIESEPVTELHFFTLRGATLAEQVGVETNPISAVEQPLLSPRLAGAADWLGFDLLHGFENRAGRAAGTALVFFTLPKAQPSGSRETLLMYRFDPLREQSVALTESGNQAQTYDEEYRWLYLPISSDRVPLQRWSPEARVSDYSVSVDVRREQKSNEMRSSIKFTPSAPTVMLRLSLAPRLQVSCVEWHGRALEFAQWGFKELDPALDRTIVVRFPEPIPASVEQELTIEAAGKLVRSEGWVEWRSTLRPPGTQPHDFPAATNVLLAEDLWYPQLDDPGRSVHEVALRTSAKDTAVSSGILIGRDQREGEATYRYLTDRPINRTTFWVAELTQSILNIEAAQIETYIEKGQTESLKNVKYVQSETANAFNFYRQVLGPIKVARLRSVSTPNYYGRGFDELLMLSGHGGYRGDMSAADLFRAHEAAHQWFGNAVDVRDWPRDRWLMESTAEYMAMEYYLHRFEDTKLWREAIERSWYLPMTRPLVEPFQRLDGVKQHKRPSEIDPLSLGPGAVYDKGPLVIHALRYLFRATTRSDKEFWGMWRDYFATYAEKNVSTEEFIRLAEAHLKQSVPWFWNQWLYSTEIPELQWGYEVSPEEGNWRLTLRAHQLDTAWRLTVPIYIHLASGRVLSVPFWISAEQDEATITIDEKPASISLNDFFEAPIRLDKVDFKKAGLPHTAP